MNSEEEFYDAETDTLSKVLSDFTRSLQSYLVQMCSRKTLPAEMISRNNFSVWSILKKCIGMELSKIAMPVVFNEPLSFLQRISEYMEHTHLIHQACSLSDSIDRMQVVAAFAVSAVASQWERTGKPFNPLLGETFELIREDDGYRLISEQVSHHPPISAFHAQSLKQEFEFHGSIYPKLKFWGKSVEAEPKGTMTLELLKHKEAYTWTNPLCCVHNIILGKLWIEQYGTVEIVNHSTGDKCVLNFKPCGMFGKELHKVEGYIQDKSKKKRRVIYGKWTECMYSVDPKVYETYKKSDKKTGGDLKKPKQVSDEHSCEGEEADEMPEVQETVTVIPGSALLWRITPRPTHSAQMYNFTSFAMTLNELEPSMDRLMAPTDCRLRPDIRAMENGDIETASTEKERLEEKQRAARRERSMDEEDWSTRWFQLGTNPHTGAEDWLYTGGYFDRNYTDCPNIY
uniref:Oxysterol-binding protein n=1 Tax=Seriola lalandi dorsalis TaxID=1841481 RepID=A0A3B4XJR7_SERLL